ncbi:MAG: STAS domain-containing protein [Candidatus Hydrogenedentes bacterium]|nr:STAS domain-containing protein [Candidatus Hydrogenedentota bacterium]
MSTGQVLSATFGDVHVLKFVGSIGYTDEWTFPLSKSLRAYVDNLFQTPAPGSSVLIDLTEAKGIDSTNLGLLAELGKRCKSGFGTKPTIIAQQGRVLNVLQTMSFQTLFTILDVDTPIRGELDSLPDVPDSQVDVAFMILNAHKNLVSLSESNKDRFQIVVEAIEDDLRRKGRL